MKYLRTFKENNTQIDVSDVAWLYMLGYVWGGELNVNSWKNDKRMNKTITCDESLSKFPFVEIKNGKYVITDNMKLDRVIEEWFGAKTYKDSILKRYDLIKYDTNGYTISQIPEEYYLRKNPSIQKAFDIISNRITRHFNSQTCSTPILDQLSKSRRIKEFNLRGFLYDFPNEPKTIKLYRGIKSEYKIKETGYSCWTTNLEQAKRFAKYHFTGGMQFSPIYSSESYILETEVSFDDISVYIGGDESEVILKNPVENIKSYPLIFDKEEKKIIHEMEKFTRINKINESNVFITNLTDEYFNKLKGLDKEYNPKFKIMLEKIFNMYFKYTGKNKIVFRDEEFDNLYMGNKSIYEINKDLELSGDEFTENSDYGTNWWGNLYTISTEESADLLRELSNDHYNNITKYLSYDIVKKINK